jgi:sec-independent protein translocase protein TatB
MFGLGMGEIVVILIVALLVLGPEKLPDAAKSIGRTIRDLRRHTRDLQDTIEKDEAIGGTVRELKSAFRGDEYSPYRNDDPLPPSRFKAPEVEPVPAGVTAEGGEATPAETGVAPAAAAEAAAAEPAAPANSEPKTDANAKTG